MFWCFCFWPVGLWFLWLLFGYEVCGERVVLLPLVCCFVVRLWRMLLWFASSSCMLLVMFAFASSFRLLVGLWPWFLL